MPDAEGNQKAEATETPLHAYKGREDEMESGDLGEDPDESRLPEGEDESGSYQRGGHASEPEGADPTDAGSPTRSANVADGALDDTVTHPEAGDEGLGTKTGGVDGPDR